MGACPQQSSILLSAFFVRFRKLISFLKKNLGKVRSCTHFVFGGKKKFARNVPVGGVLAARSIALEAK